jgi:hypothetical protein
MLVLILIVALLATFLIVFTSSLSNDDLQADWRHALLITLIIGAGLVAISSEGLSLFKAITQTSLAVFWGLILIILLFIGWRGGYFSRSVSLLKQQLTGVSWRNIESLFLLICGFYVSILLIIAWFAPPNTNDSLAYHMSRVMNWIQDQSLQHYAATNDRQLYMPIGAELIIMQLHLLAGSDRLSNLVQWFSMVGSLAGVSLIAKRLGAGCRGQILSVAFCVSIPMGILQASSTQTDYVTALWLVCLGYFSILASQRGLQLIEWLWLSLTFALGILTKGTFVAFTLPFLAWLLVVTVRKSGWLQTIKYALVGILLTLILNMGSWQRNIQTFDFPLGPREGVGSHTNEIFGVGVLISNVMRNSTLHLGTPFGVINGPIRDFVEEVDRLIGQDANDPRTSMNPYRVKRSQNEDYAGNPLHFLLMPASLIFLIWRFKKHKSWDVLKQTILYAILIIAGFLVFSEVYKWQIWGSRVQLPIFVAWSSVIGMALDGDRFYKIRNIVMLILLLSGLGSLLSNPSRPVIPNKNGQSIFRTARENQLFANYPEVEKGYLSIIAATKATGCRNVGLKIDSSHPEYPFWALLSPDGKQVRIENIDPSPTLSKYLRKDFQPCAIICTICSEQSLQNLNLASTHYGGYSLYLPAQTSP